MPGVYGGYHHHNGKGRNWRSESGDSSAGRATCGSASTTNNGRVDVGQDQGAALDMKERSIQDKDLRNRTASEDYTGNGYTVMAVQVLRRMEMGTIMAMLGWVRGVVGRGRNGAVEL